jgi:hypothetical protein
MWIRFVFTLGILLNVGFPWLNEPEGIKGGKGPKVRVSRVLRLLWGIEAFY